MPISGICPDLVSIDHRTRSGTSWYSSAESLSKRERECLRLMAAGCKEPEIAATMGITGYTVRFHVSNICRKLDAPNRSAAIYRAAKSSII